jgi:hypothetical protein
VDFVHAELDQVFGLEPAARPTISLFKLNADKILNLVEPAIFYTGLALISGELERNDCVGRDWFVSFEACARRGDILQNRPLALNRAGCRIPLDLNKIRAKFSIFSSLWAHKVIIGKSC